MKFRGDVILLLALAILALAHLRLGPETAAALLDGSLPEWREVVLRDIRFPRLLLAILVGSGIALAGQTIQTVSRNPLASPDILGVPAAAALGVLLVITLGRSASSSIAMPLAAAFAGIAASLVVLALAALRGGLGGSGVLLTGIAFGALVSAASFAIALHADPEAYAYIVGWLAGSLSRASWETLSLLYVPWATGVTALAMLAPRLVLLGFDDDTAIGLGARPSLLRPVALAAASAVASICVAIAGSFGFLGFFTPHVIRLATGRETVRPLTACLTGAVLLVGADRLGQSIYGAAEIPAGLVVSIVGSLAFALALLGPDVSARRGGLAR